MTPSEMCSIHAEVWLNAVDELQKDIDLAFSETQKAAIRANALLCARIANAYAKKAGEGEGK